MNNSIFSSNLMIDFHTHRAKHPDRVDIIEVISSPVPLADHQFSLERHPWYSLSSMDEEKSIELKTQLKHQNCLALGEIGLDKNKGAEFDVQLAELRSLLSIANEEKIPVVIHCVKAFDEIIQLKKEFNHVPNWAIHGFNKNHELATQLINHGFYLSINCCKLNGAQQLLDAIPNNRLFLETDNSSFLIEENYLRTAELMGMDVLWLKSTIAQNAKLFFEHE